MRDRLKKSRERERERERENDMNSRKDICRKGTW